jgi:hypothetical protein
MESILCSAMNRNERQFMGTVKYRGYTIKVVQQGDEIKLLIYAPGDLMAQQIVVDRFENHEEAMSVAKVKIDRRINPKGV